MLPVLLALLFGRLPGINSWGRKILVPVAASVLVVAKIRFMAWIDPDAFRRAAQQEHEGAACVRSTCDPPSPVRCNGFYPSDIGPALEPARERDLAVWRSLVQVP